MENIKRQIFLDLNRIKITRHGIEIYYDHFKNN